MQYFEKFQNQLRNRLFWLVLVCNVAVIGVVVVVTLYSSMPLYQLAGLAVVSGLLLAMVATFVAMRLIALPTKTIAEAILHVSSEATTEVPAPDPTQLHFGQELVASLIHDVYELATQADQQKQITAANGTLFGRDFVASVLPLPLIITDPGDTIVFANEAAGTYLGIPHAEMVGKNVYSLLDMLFTSEDTLDNWLAATKTKSVTASKSWEHVRLEPSDTRPLRLFDLAVYYNRENPDKFETMLVLFDHTQAYSQDDQAVSFIALSVHELRTPLTLLRGYIEAFEDEFAGKLNPQMNDFMFKMSATAQQLTAFVNNILNVARVDGDQLTLQLHEEEWGGIIRAAANNLALRARVRGITIEYSVAQGLPSVGVDRVSILEVITNLVDNAIKYSGNSDRIRIDTHLTPEGMVETTIQDWGVGIPPNVLPNLFTKFYRDHHNRAQIGGTGLGLYLSKAIVHAHGGTIWVKSNPGEGSIFGFTLLPFTQLADEQKNAVNQDITRGAHGWIKNHSLYRR